MTDPAPAYREVLRKLRDQRTNLLPPLCLYAAMVPVNLTEMDALIPLLERELGDDPPTS